MHNYPWAKFRYRQSFLCLMALLILSGSYITQVHATEFPQYFTDLDDDTSQWNIFQDGGHVTGTIQSVDQSGSGDTTLKASLLGGDPYTGMHVYRNLPFVGGGTQFAVSMDFYFTNINAIQALEFTMNTWQSDQRWEWAMQWEHFGDGGSQQGNPPAWRVWTGTSWQDTGITQALEPFVWHEFHLYGTIIAGNVHYTGFSCDNIATELTQTFAFMFSSGEKLAVGVQLDGDSQEDPYDLYLDKVNFQIS